MQIPKIDIGIILSTVACNVISIILKTDILELEQYNSEVGTTSLGLAGCEIFWYQDTVDSIMNPFLTSSHISCDPILSSVVINLLTEISPAIHCNTVYV